MTDQITTVIYAAGTKYAIRNLTPLEALKLAATTPILKLHGPGEAIYLRANAITHTSTWPDHPTHQPIWKLTDASKGGRPTSKGPQA